MIAIPSFEHVAIVGDDAWLAAEISSLFTRPRRYLTVMDGPRLTRPDYTNEVIRRTNALSLAQTRRVVFANLPADQSCALSERQPAGMFISANTREEARSALRGWTKGPAEKLAWGRDHLGVGLLLARRSKKFLDTAEETSPPINFVSGGTHLLIVCEAGEDLAEVTGSNLAFATDASLLTVPQLPDRDQDQWLEEIYALGSGENVTTRFACIRDRVRTRLPAFDFREYKQVLFITNGFPWGMAMPERPTTHLFAYPDLGRMIVEGIWAASRTGKSARTALLIQSDHIAGSEIEAIRESLKQNQTLVRIQAGPRATVHNVRMLLETVPFDIVVISTHAGDVSGKRVTYKFTDSEGIARCLVVDEAVGFGYDPTTEKVCVQTFCRFHELDGVDWSDSVAKSSLYVGSAISTWSAMGDVQERAKYRVASEEIIRVNGSMGLRMSDDVWLPMMHGFAPGCTPIVFNNACSSWHELSKRFMFPGASAYIGTLFPVTEAEAQAVGTSFFQRELGKSLPVALWASQNHVYERQDRRPYAMCGLPFSSIQRNTIDSIAFLSQYYPRAIATLSRKANTTAIEELRENFIQQKDFLSKEAEILADWIRS